MTARITRLEIEGFRVIDKLSLELRPMNVLIGESGSGKSTVLEALEILRKAATMSGTTFFNDLYDLHGGPRMFRGTDVRATRNLAFGVTIHQDQGGNDTHYRLALQATADGGIQVLEESLELLPLTTGALPLNVFQRHRDNGTLFNLVSGQPERVVLPATELLLTSFRAIDGANPAMTRVREMLAAIRVYPASESNPAWARRPNEPTAASRSNVVIRPASIVEPGGANLPNVFQALRNRSPAAWEDIKRTIRLGLGDDIEDLTIEPSPGGGR